MVRLSLVVLVAGCSVVSGLDDFGIGGPGGAPATGGAGGHGGEASGGGGAGGAPVAEPPSCQAIKDAQPEAADGLYPIDPDGDGVAFVAECDMTIDGGGWTRFHWVSADVPEDTDPLGGNLAACEPDAPFCLGRIPAMVEPVDLLVKDLSSGEHAAFHLDQRTIARALVEALRDKVQHCLLDQDPLDPYIDTSNEYYCGQGGETGCDTFTYAHGGCVPLVDDRWTLQLDGDRYFASSAFKLGWTNTSNLCAQEVYWDRGYLDELGCGDERGALFYR